MKGYILIGLAGFLLAVIGKYFLPDFVSPPPVDSSANLPRLELTLQEPCLLREMPCTASDTAGHFVSFSLSPKNIPLMKELQVSAETSGIANIRSALLTVEGVNMFMGYQYADMRPDNTGKLNGKLTLPVCSMEKMQWKATLELVTDSVVISSSYPFETIRN